jgi:hypothetical protein
VSWSIQPSAYVAESVTKSTSPKPDASPVRTESWMTRMTLPCPGASLPRRPSRRQLIGEWWLCQKAKPNYPVLSFSQSPSPETLHPKCHVDHTTRGTRVWQACLSFHHKERKLDLGFVHPAMQFPFGHVFKALASFLRGLLCVRSRVCFCIPTLIVSCRYSSLDMANHAAIEAAR